MCWAHSEAFIIRKFRGTMMMARVKEKRNAWKVLVGKPDGQRPLERPGVNEIIVLK
jgi:hypothetical protein